MATKKIKVHLEPSQPAYLCNSLHPKQNPLHTLELTDFSIGPNRVEWFVRCGDGSIIEGRLGDQRPIPFLNTAAQPSWIALYIPITLHRKPRGVIAPDFILMVPDYIKVDFKQTRTA